MDFSNNDTICAIATAAGGAIGIIRVSGCDSIRITDSIFSRNLLHATANTISYGNILDGTGKVVDEVLVSVFRSPHSYTGEDSTEISCHGSAYILSRVLRLLIDAGCRQAQPGEFTRRAFANGKLDLSQAEAVADLIASTNEATHRIAIGQLRGNISTSLSSLRDQLLKMTSLLELELDFSDHEELEFADRGELRQLAVEIDSHIVRMMDSFSSGQAIKRGIPVAIVGKTNVGKSTLLNCLIGEERAIVSDVHGTTRDVIEDAIDINGVTFRFIDTAGLRDTTDEIERIGISLAYRKLEEATIVLWVVDEMPVDEDVKRMMQHCGNRQLIVVNNKTDRNDFVESLSSVLASTPVVGISARSGANVSRLREIIYESANIPSISANDVVVTSSLGLCGSYNYNVIKTFTNLYKNGDEVLPIGTTGYNLLKNEKDLIIHDKFVNIMENLEISKIRILEKYLFKLFKEKKFKKIVLLYTHYKNAISFQVKSFDLLPITFDLVEKTKLNPGDYDPNISSFAHRIAKKFVISTIYIKLFESFLSEQASRRNAMENADKNASELIDKLKIQFNKARQAAITQEITEVVAGSLNK